jgi:hypothetical protein
LRDGKGRGIGTVLQLAALEVKTAYVNHESREAKQHRHQYGRDDRNRAPLVAQPAMSQRS